MSLGPFALTREGLTFGLDLGRPDPGRLPRLGRRSCSRPWPTTCSRRSSPRARATGSRSSSCRRSRWCRGCRSAPARSSRPSRRAAWPSTGLVRARGSGRSSRSSGRSCSARSSTSASGPSPSRRAASGRGRVGRPIGSSPIRRSTAGCASASSSAVRRRRRRRPSPGVLAMTDDARRATPLADRRASASAIPGRREPRLADVDLDGRRRRARRRRRPDRRRQVDPGARRGRVHPARRPGDARRAGSMIGGIRHDDAPPRTRCSGGSASSSRRRPTSCRPRS